jgi:hypothetical protein
VLSNSRDIKNLDKVFGFAAQMYNNCAFVYRRGAGDNGTHFIGYVPAAPPSANSVLLDATAEIDKVSELCRSLTDLLGFLTDLHAKGVDLFLHQQGLDTSTPSGRAMFQMLGVFAEFERAMIRERVMAGLARARAEGKQLGRRSVEQSHGAKVKAVLKLRSRGIGIRRIAREVGLGVGTVIRLVGNEGQARPA